MEEGKRTRIPSSANAAVEEAEYELSEDGSHFGEVTSCPRVWANEATVGAADIETLDCRSSVRPWFSSLALAGDCRVLFPIDEVAPSRFVMQAFEEHVAG